jgi:hypothetical protein
MRFEQQHDLGQAEAIRRIDSLLEALLARTPPGGITISNAEKRWSGNRMDFAFNASRGFFGTSISGSMLVNDHDVVVEAQLPGIVRAFVAEDTVRDVIRRELQRLLA